MQMSPPRSNNLLDMTAQSQMQGNIFLFIDLFTSEGIACSLMNSSEKITLK